jgi:hypothetical protein
VAVLVAVAADAAAGVVAAAAAVVAAAAVAAVAAAAAAATAVAAAARSAGSQPRRSDGGAFHLAPPCRASSSKSMELFISETIFVPSGRAVLRTKARAA